MTVVSPAGINADGGLQVSTADGSPIPNLYAAGEVLGFARLSGAGFLGGMSLTPALTFGRLLGQKITQRPLPRRHRTWRKPSVGNEAA